MLKNLLGKNKNKNKKTKLIDLSGQAYLDAYNKQMRETGKSTLAEKARFFKETQKLRRIAEKEAGN